MSVLTMMQLHGNHHDRFVASGRKARYTYHGVIYEIAFVTLMDVLYWH